MTHTTGKTKSKWLLDEKHNHLTCEGAICAADPTPGWQDNVVWYPDEPVCGARPIAHWQKIQRRIKRLYDKGELKHSEYYFTASTLDKKHTVRPSVRGKNPNQPVDRTPMRQNAKLAGGYA